MKMQKPFKSAARSREGVTSVATTPTAFCSSRRVLKQLLKDQSGTSLLELAIAAPVFVFLAIGISDLSHNFTARHAVHGAMNTAMELGQLGPVAGSYEHIKAEAASAANVPLDNVTLEQWLECNDQKRDFQGACDSGQIALRYIRLEIRKSYTPMFGRMGYSTVGPDGTTTIRSQSFMRVGT
jgi:hypothetical protein